MKNIKFNRSDLNAVHTWLSTNIPCMEVAEDKNSAVDKCGNILWRITETGPHILDDYILTMFFRYKSDAAMFRLKFGVHD